ncbi:MAG: hypothetical protein K6T85_01830 [Gorillibacterium sp.]|nr:hypothetical protein [Gorillibacterium sp.]
MNIGRRIYYDKETGNIIQDAGERSGDVIETTVYQDFISYLSLAERVPDTVGYVELEYGQYTQDFAEGRLERIDLGTLTPLFSYSDPIQSGEPTPPQQALAVQVATLKIQAVEQEQRLGDIEVVMAELLGM